MPDLLSGLIGALIGALATAAAALWTMARQIREMRQGMQAQTYLELLKRAQDIRLSATMDFIRGSIVDSPGIFDHDSNERASMEPSVAERERYQWFSEKVPPLQRDAIRTLIDFFNDLAHLMYNRYIDDHYV